MELHGIPQSVLDLNREEQEAAVVLFAAIEYLDGLDELGAEEVYTGSEALAEIMVSALSLCDGDVAAAAPLVWN